MADVGAMYRNGKKYGGILNDLSASEFVPASGFTCTNKRLLRTNNVIYLRAKCVKSSGNLTNGITLGTLPQNFYPDVETVGIPVCVRSSSAVTTGFLTIGTDGTVSLDPKFTATSYNEVDIAVSFPI
jgi:hypothetical protein